MAVLLVKILYIFETLKHSALDRLRVRLNVILFWLGCHGIINNMVITKTIIKFATAYQFGGPMRPRWSYIPLGWPALSGT